MIKYTKKYQKIVNELIRKSFPELKNRRIKFILIPFFFSLSGTVMRGRKRDYIFYIGRKISKKDKKAFIGFLVHEIAHIKDLQRLPPFDSFVKFNLLNDLLIFLPIFKKFERNADLISIKKGYAKEIYNNVVKASKKYPKWIVNYVHSRGYLSPDKIKSYAKKIGKW